MKSFYYGLCLNMEREYEYTPLYISTPCQVKYFDNKTKDYRGGIAFKDDLIMSNGDVIKIDHYSISIGMENNMRPDDVIIPLDWSDLSDAILN